MEVQEREHYHKLLALEEAMIAGGDVMDIEKHTRHHFCNGAYVREFFLPKGYVVTGKIHRYGCINILLSGRIAISQADGLSTIMEAGTIYNSEGGEKKVLYALENAVFLNVHSLPPELAECTEEDMEKLENHFIVPSLEMLEQERQEALEVQS